MSGGSPGADMISMEIGMRATLYLGIYRNWWSNFPPTGEDVLRHQIMPGLFSKDQWLIPETIYAIYPDPIKLIIQCYVW